MSKAKTSLADSWFRRMLFFLGGGIILCIFSTLQKIFVGYPIVLEAYVVPLLFGGFAGLSFGLCCLKIRESRQILQRAHDELDVKVREKTESLENILLELKKTDEKYRSIFNQSPIAIEYYDEKGMLLEVNTACLDLFGIKSIQEIKGFNLFDDPNLPEAQKRRLTSGKIVRYQSIFNFEKVKELELYTTSRDGVIWIDVLITSLRYPPYGYLLQIQNITNQKLAEMKWVESEARWQFALDGANDGVWDWDASTNRVYFSSRWKTMLGFSDDEIGNTLFEWDSRIHPDDRDSTYADLKKHFNGDTPLYQNEHRLLCKDGSYKWILDRGKIVERKEDGTPLRVIGTHSDITARKEHESEREKLISALNEEFAKVKKLSGLLPICSHCKKIRDDSGYWNSVEVYIERHSEAEFSHGICRECAKKYYPDMDLYDDNETQG